MAKTHTQLTLVVINSESVRDCICGGTINRVINFYPIAPRLSGTETDHLAILGIKFEISTCSLTPADTRKVIFRDIQDKLSRLTYRDLAF